MRSAEQNDVTARSQRTHGSQRFRKAHAQIGQVQALRFGETEHQRNGDGFAQGVHAKQ